MTDNLINSVVTVATAIIGLAILAVLVSRQANTAGVIKAAASGLSQNIAAAVSPVTGGGFGFSGGAPLDSFNY